jgi:hypothetical protein
MEQGIDKNTLNAVAVYCNGDVEDLDLDTLNKISEVVSLAAQKKRGKLSEAQLVVVNDALAKWVSGESTPIEYKNIFRKAN